MMIGIFQNKTFNFIFAAAFLSVAFFGVSILAQETPPVGVPSDIPSGPPAAPPTGGVPAEEEFQKFQEETGFKPAEYLKEAEPERPKFEEPGKIPDEIKQYVSGKELVEIYCATVRWKSGGFFTAMDAVKKHVVPAVEKAKELNIQVDLPDVYDLKANGLKKIEAICAAATLDEAERLVLEFSDWGQKEAIMKFDGLRSSLEEKLKEKGDEFRDRIKTEIDAFVSEERQKIERDLRLEAEQLAAAKKQELEAAQDPNVNVNAIRNQLQNKIQSKANQKKSELEAKVRNKIKEIMGDNEEKFKEIGNIFKGLGSKINDEIKAGESAYAQYKEQAFLSRKILVSAILDKNIESGLKKLEEERQSIEDARKEDPTIKSVDQIKTELQDDRRELITKLDAAIRAGDETSFQNALADFKMKWETYRREMEKAASQAVGKACTVALAQFKEAKPRIDDGSKKIRDLQAECAGGVSDECLKINEFAPRFGTILGKFDGIKSEMAIAEKMCQTPETADRQNLIALMRKIQADAEDLKIYGEALEAEKQKAIAESARQICAQVLPQLDAAKTELAKNDIVVLRNNVKKCANQTGEECKIVNQLAPQFKNFESTVNEFSSNISKAEEFCAAPEKENLEDLRNILEPLKQRGDDLRALGKELQAAQAEKANEKIICRAVIPELEIAKGKISDGLLEAAAARNECAGKTDNRCVGINALADKFAEVKNQGESILKKISDINAVCSKAGTNPPSASFIENIGSLKADAETLKKSVADLKAEKEKHYEIGSEITIPNGSFWEGELPRANTLEIFGRINYPKAAGGQWLMEISVNGKPISSPLLNKGGTFKYADGRSFPYYSPGGGSGTTSFIKSAPYYGRSYTYYFSPKPAWMLFYVPDFKTDDTTAAGGYQVLTDQGQAHHYVWNVSDLAGSAETMLVKIKHNGLISAAGPLIIKLYAK